MHEIFYRRDRVSESHDCRNKDKRIQATISKRIDKLGDDPNLQGKPLKGSFSGYRSLRAVGQRYRIVYRVLEKKVIVHIVGVGIRKEGSKDDIYTRLKKLIEDIKLGSEKKD